MKYPIKFELSFKKHEFPGKLIVFEGIDGSGKTTQAQKLVEELQNNGIEAVYTKEPTDGEIGKLIRRILVGEKKFEPVSFQYLFSADRVEHQEEILELLKKGKTVVSDRYFWSSVPYGATDRGIDFKKNQNEANILIVCYSILSLYHQFIVPDKTIYLNADPATALDRLWKARHIPDIYDRIEKLEKIAAGYEWLIKKFPEEFIVIDANKAVDEVSKEMLVKLESVLTPIKSGLK